jgi:hypothetical protein
MRAIVGVFVVLVAGCAVPQDDPTASTSHSSSTGLSSASSSSLGSPGPAWTPEPDTLFLLLRRSFEYERESGDGVGPGFYRGGHCGHGRYTRDPLAVHVIDYPNEYSRTSTPPPSQDPWTPTGLLFNAWDQQNSTDKPVSSIGWGSTIDGFDAAASALAIPRALGSGSVANVTADDGRLEVDGETLETGVPHTITATYTHTEGSSEGDTTYRVTETLVFTAMGLAKVTAEYPEHPCI